jgi:ribosomal protein S27AE
MPSPSVGQDIEDTCSRCGDTWHVVMAKLGERIAKVVCKRCGGQHNYRGPGGPTATETATAGPASTFGRRTIPRRKLKKNEETATPTPNFDPNKAPRPYSVRDIYAPGERLVHPSFGTGVVATVPGPGKVEVVFPAGARTLACAKAESTLSRPVNVDHAPIGDRPPDKPL